MLKNLTAALAVVLLAAGAGFTQDDFFNRRNTTTNRRIPIKVIDNGDGTFSMAVKTPGATSSSTGTYKLRGELGFSAPATVSRTGSGLSWIFNVKGGSATFRVNGGDPTFADKGDVLGDDFQVSTPDPSIDIDFLEAGATFQVLFGMAE